MVKNITIKLYTGAFNKLKLNGILKKDIGYTQILNIFDMTTKGLSNSTKKTYLKALIYFNKKDNLFTNEIMKHIQRRLKIYDGKEKKRVFNQELTITQKKNIITWEKVLEIFNNLEDIKDKFVLSLFVLFPPRRLKDYDEMIYRSKMGRNLSIDKNYYISNKSEFIFNTYKTDYIYGQQKFKISEDLKNIIEGYIHKYKIKEGSKIIDNIGYLLKTILLIYN